jgi:hypothetical protein
MAKTKQGKKDVDSYTIGGTNKVVRGTCPPFPHPRVCGLLCFSGEESDAGTMSLPGSGRLRADAGVRLGNPSVRGSDGEN